MNANIKEVLIVFKTHLDIGFCDMGETVVKNYLEHFIPNAIKRGYELKDTNTPFVWTTGSWLINEALKRDTDGSVAKAIEDIEKIDSPDEPFLNRVEINDMIGFPKEGNTAEEFRRAIDAELDKTFPNYYSADNFKG